ncbi:MAG: hypothetical protein R3C99_22915 [Pirellulaceae bacterium]
MLRRRPGAGRRLDRVRTRPKVSCRIASSGKTRASGFASPDCSCRSAKTASLLAWNASPSFRA